MKINPISYNQYNNRKIQQNPQNPSFGSLLKFENTLGEHVDDRRLYKYLMETIANSKPINDYIAQNDIKIYLHAKRKTRNDSAIRFSFIIKDEGITKEFDKAYQEREKIAKTISFIEDDFPYEAPNVICSKFAEMGWFVDGTVSESRALSELLKSIKNISADDLEKSKKENLSKIQQALSTFKKKASAVEMRKNSK